MKHKGLIIALLILGFDPGTAAATDRPSAIVLEMDVPASPEATWAAWTSDAGARAFFADETRIEPRIGGAYEIYFLPRRPLGLRGSETATILAMEAPRRLMFSWNAPEQFGELRNQLTVVEIEMEPTSGGGTHITLTHSNWGRGERWARVREYFAGAWPFVLGRLAESFRNNPRRR